MKKYKINSELKVLQDAKLAAKKDNEAKEIKHREKLAAKESQTKDLRFIATVKVLVKLLNKLEKQAGLKETKFSEVKDAIDTEIDGA